MPLRQCQRLASTYRCTTAAASATAYDGAATQLSEAKCVTDR